MYNNLLNFIGTGNEFNTELGNTSAYFINNNNFYLIDCGSMVFDILIDDYFMDSMIKNFDSINVIITHTHADRIGSLPTFIRYFKHIHNIKVNLFLSYGENIVNLLKINDVHADVDYKIQFIEEYEFYHIDSNVQIKAVSVGHSPSIMTYGYIIKVDEKVIYYSGDANNFGDDIESLIHQGYFDEIYHDASCETYDYDKECHMSLETLINTFSKEEADKFYLMNLGLNFDYKLATDHGFHICERF
ncbi:ribonuclease BN [Listeria phage LPJP1]|nr:ribonuclease BN [Listeria phage LPJP1]